ncbi:UvrD-helicase domain-containing protein [Calditerrivibrio nitroreducens]|uniref:DNA 3'-5' helicase n=1 Tax=Calditerrivibrio nitroreducens (strain DSM 19672 / NBRC 101217 / Yu37-1) TaxID=768670 RepID=E4TG66_CALNY|nr:UvrD-helicase domain-containing protein [Calditerrivibrio nitroreducens]ADR19653.1 UvrD/REP helicase [Calditerrivibrio nitroreducens DSM 19672]
MNGNVNCSTEDNLFKQFLSIKASAGSGKTYNLASRFIELLGLYLKNKNFSVAIIPPKDLSSIIAITFTNKASLEMKDRVMKFLKGLGGIRKNELEKSDITKEDARKLLIHILKNFEHINVTTIDSFMNTLHKAFAVDLGVYPDYDITFDSEKIFESAVEMLFEDEKNFEDLINFLNTLLILDKDGMDGEKIIIKNLKEYHKIELPENVISYDELEKRIKGDINSAVSELNEYLLKEINDLSDKLNNLIDKYDTMFNGNKIKSYKLLDVDKVKKNYAKYHEFIENNNFNEILKKGGTIPPEEQKLFREILKEILKNFRYYLLLKYTKESEAIFKQIEKLKEKENDVQKRLNIVDGSQITKRITEILKSDSGVPYAFCNLGEQIMHYLIDEFQDTSRDQFEAIRPLLENSKGSGGSIFIVGDKKQSIYGWRGGDYTLFDEVDNDFALESITLKGNYRSGKDIVNFNNICFAKALLNDIPELIKKYDISENLSEEIKKVYSDASQIPVQDFKGYINIHLKKRNDEDTDDFYKNRLIRILETLFKRGANYSDIMILVRNNNDIETVVDWIHSKDQFKNIPFITDGNLKIINNFNIKKILLASSFIIDPEDTFYIKSVEELGLLNCFNDLNIYPSGYSPYEFFLSVIDLLKIENDLYLKRFLEEVAQLTLKGKNIREIIEYFYENQDISISSSDEADAIRIMSIHKSKGLQSEIVILPIFDWELYKTDRMYDYIPLSDVLEDYAGEEKIFTTINSLKDISETAKNIYEKKIKSQLIEGLNLMYVAQTRAVRELYITGMFSKNLSGSYPRPLRSSAILYEMLDNLEKYEDGSGIDYAIEKNEMGIFFVCGELKDFGSKSFEKNEDIKVNKCYSPDSIIFRIRKSFIDEPDIEDLREGMKLGTDIHKLLSVIRKIDDEKNIEAEVERAFKRSQILYDKKMFEMVINTVRDLKDYFIDIDDCWTEKEFVTKSGNIFRVDRIVKKGSFFYIIDYKTGDPKEEDRKQVDIYRRLIPYETTGIIYYIKKGEKLYVSSKSN